MDVPYRRTATVLATWFGCGKSPIGPGTAGSLGALVPIAVLQAAGVPHAHWMVFAAVLMLLAPGIWASGVYARASNKKDPGSVVVDEVLGQWLTVAFAPDWSWVSLGVAFALFRVFDIVKPPPARQAERLAGGLGIVADDLVAGLFGGLVFLTAGWFNLY